MKQIIFILLLFPFYVYAGLIETENAHIKISLDDNNGSFYLSTVDGNPSKPEDNFKGLLFQKIPATSYAILNINSEIINYGSSPGFFRVKPTVSDGRIISEWVYKDISVIQELKITSNSFTGRLDIMEITYSISNESKKDATVGLKLLLDSCAGREDPSFIYIYGKGKIEKEQHFVKEEIPDYWYYFDKDNNPQVGAIGELKNIDLRSPDKIVFARWDRLNTTEWDVISDPRNSFIKAGTTKPDIASLYFFNPVTIKTNSSYTIKTRYGLFEQDSISYEKIKFNFNVPTNNNTLPVKVEATIQNISTEEINQLDLILYPPERFTLSENEYLTNKFYKIQKNQTINQSWNLITPITKINTNYNIFLKIRYIVNNTTNEILTTNNFNLSFNQNPLSQEKLNKLNEYFSKIISGKDTQLSEENIIVTNKPKTYVLSDEEKAILNDIKYIDNLIKEIDNEYKLLENLYKNLYKSQPDIITNIDNKLKLFSEELNKQRLLLEEQKKYLNKPK